MNQDVGRFLRKYLRKTHRWLALPFAALIVVVLLTRDSSLGLAVQQTQQVLLLVMALTGLYLFLLPWWTRWKRGRGGVEESRTRREHAREEESAGSSSSVGPARV